MNSINETSAEKACDRKETVKLIMDYLHRTVMHHAQWFTEVEHQLGREKAREALGVVLDRSLPIQLKRLSRTLGFELRDGLPAPLLDLPDEKLAKLQEAVAVNWLVNDGVWFQALEFTRGMNDAKRVNDTCWARFSPFEAWSCKRLLGLGDRPGLQGLARALGVRVYATVNRQSIRWESPSSLMFEMNDCRVQSARKRKGLDDYPCKSGGLIEYTSFAETIDPRIRTECIGCPPDDHPDGWYCAWRFTIQQEGDVHVEGSSVDLS